MGFFDATMPFIRHPKILIIEPHGDDALISASTIIDMGIRKGYDIVIATIGHSRDSSKLSEYYDIDNILYYDLPELDYKLKPKINTHDIHSRYSEGLLCHGYVKDLILSSVRESVGEQEFNRIVDKTDRVIVDLLNKYQKDKRNIIVSPYGLDHPYHILISNLITNYINIHGMSVSHLMYADKPYTAKRYIRESLEVDLKESSKNSYSIGLGTKSYWKEEAFRSVYPTEKTLLRFTRDAVLTDPDQYIFTADSYDEEMFYRLFEIKEMLS